MPSTSQPAISLGVPCPSCTLTGYSRPAYRCTERPGCTGSLRLIAGNPGEPGGGWDSGLHPSEVEPRGELLAVALDSDGIPGLRLASIPQVLPFRVPSWARLRVRSFELRADGCPLPDGIEVEHRGRRMGWRVFNRWADQARPSLLPMLGEVKVRLPPGAGTLMICAMCEEVTGAE